MYYAEDTEDSFEDFLEWRRWKREKARVGGGQVVMIESGRSAGEARVNAAPVAALPPATSSIPSSGSGVVPPSQYSAVSKGKEEAAAPLRSTAGGVPRVGGSNTSTVGSGADPNLQSAAVSSTAAVAAASSAPVAVPAAKVAVPAAQENTVSPAGEKWVADLNAASDKGKKEMRGEVLAQTRAILAAGKYTSEAGVLVELDVVGASVGRTVFANDHKFEPFVTPYNTTAHFVKADAIDTALFLIEKKGVNPFVVIPADPKNIGGGFAGSASLEEQLYRRSTALLAVEGDFKYDVPSRGGIYLPSVQVFREAEFKSGYQLLKAPRKVAFLLASSLEKPKYELKGKSCTLGAEEQQELVERVKAILSIGLAKGHDAIVVSAFGCGFNQTPPQAVAAVFRDLLTEQFSNTYKHVTFAILEDENCMKPHNPNGNLVPFQQEFLTVSTKTTKKGKCC